MTEHEADAVSVQLGELKAPAPLLLKVTVPVAGTGPAPVPWPTVPVQVVGAPGVTGSGVQWTVVVVGARTTVTAALPLLATWVRSPGYAAVMV